MGRIFLVATLVSANYGPSLWAQLPAEAINLSKVKISEKQKSIDICPVHFVEADPILPSWIYKGVQYRGHTPLIVFSSLPKINLW